MQTSELISAAAAIAGHLAAHSFQVGNLAPGDAERIAKAAVQIAREIETQARIHP